MRLEIAFVEGQIESEVGAGLTRREIAKTYRLALGVESYEVDWPRINKAILGRFKPSGLEWIKKQAWSGKCFR